MHTKQVLVGGRVEGWGGSLGLRRRVTYRPYVTQLPPHALQRQVEPAEVPPGQRPRRPADGPAHLDVDEDDLYVFRFEEPLQGLHEVLRDGGRGMEEGETLPSSPAPERLGQGDRDGKRQTETERLGEKETKMGREKETRKQKQAEKERQRWRMST